MSEEEEKTSLYSLDDFEETLVKTTLKEVCIALKEKGYNEINQLVGYIMSGDPGYISSHNDAREKISSIERSTIIEVLLRNYINKL
ncbi:MAG: IreB family regulatory phosphoprotein [Bacilli bacterium]|nr:IreB family regulatory phosphoprotein [Bacilli bacterium]